MKRCTYHSFILGLAAGLFCATGALPANAEAAKAPPSAAAPAKTANASPAEVELPKSVFTIPAGPKEGRNPFFPMSSAALPASPKPVDMEIASGFVLNGITSPPKRTAMINGRTFEPGEESEVKLPSGGKILVKCLEIRDDSAVIQVAGQRRELRLRFGI